MTRPAVFRQIALRRVSWSQWCFDCDGTILDCAPSFTAAHEHAVRLLGGQPVRDYWRRRRAGASDRALCALAGLEDQDFERYRTLRQHAFNTSSTIAPPFPAAMRLLERLRRLDLRVVVISHRSSVASLIRDLRRAGLSVDALSCYATKSACTHLEAPCDPSITKARVLTRLAAVAPTVMIGDSDTDIAAARAARVSSIGVATGCCSLRRLQEAGATQAFPSLAELDRWLVEKPIIDTRFRRSRLAASTGCGAPADRRHAGRGRGCRSGLRRIDP